MGIGSFPGVKRPGRDFDHPPPSSAEVKGGVELYLHPSRGPFVASSRVNFNFAFRYSCYNFTPSIW